MVASLKNRFALLFWKFAEPFPWSAALEQSGRSVSVVPPPRLLEKVMPVGGPSAYLATMYPDQDTLKGLQVSIWSACNIMSRAVVKLWTFSDAYCFEGFCCPVSQDSLLKFAEWIDTFAPADGSTGPETPWIVFPTRVIPSLSMIGFPSRANIWWWLAEFACIQEGVCKFYWSAVSSPTMDAWFSLRFWRLWVLGPWSWRAFDPADPHRGVGSWVSVSQAQSCQWTFNWAVGWCNVVPFCQSLDSSLRFSSDPDRVGAEKLSMTAVPKAYLEAEYIELPACIGSA